MHIVECPGDLWASGFILFYFIGIFDAYYQEILSVQ